MDLCVCVCVCVCEREREREKERERERERERESTYQYPVFLDPKYLDQINNLQVKIPLNEIEGNWMCGRRKSYSKKNTSQTCLHFEFGNSRSDNYQNVCWAGDIQIQYSFSLLISFPCIPYPSHVTYHVYLDIYVFISYF